MPSGIDPVDTVAPPLSPSITPALTNRLELTVSSSPTTASPDKKKMKKVKKSESDPSRAGPMDENTAMGLGADASLSSILSQTASLTTTDGTALRELSPLDSVFRAQTDTQEYCPSLFTDPKMGNRNPQSQGLIPSDNSESTDQVTAPKTTEKNPGNTPNASSNSEEQMARNSAKKALFDKVEEEICGNTANGGSNAAKPVVPSPTRRKATRTQLANGFNFSHTSPTADEWAAGMAKAGKKAPAFTGAAVTGNAKISKNTANPLPTPIAAAASSTAKSLKGKKKKNGALRTPVKALTDSQMLMQRLNVLHSKQKLQLTDASKPARKRRTGSIMKSVRERQKLVASARGGFTLKNYFAEGASPTEEDKAAARADIAASKISNASTRTGIPAPADTRPAFQPAGGAAVWPAAQLPFQLETEQQLRTALPQQQQTGAIPAAPQQHVQMATTPPLPTQEPQPAVNAPAVPAPLTSEHTHLHAGRERGAWHRGHACP